MGVDFKGSVVPDVDELRDRIAALEAKATYYADAAGVAEARVAVLELALRRYSFHEECCTIKEGGPNSPTRWRDEHMMRCMCGLGGALMKA